MGERVELTTVEILAELKPEEREWWERRGPVFREALRRLAVVRQGARAFQRALKALGGGGGAYDGSALDDRVVELVALVLSSIVARYLPADQVAEMSRLMAEAGRPKPVVESAHVPTSRGGLGAKERLPKKPRRRVDGGSRRSRR